jgi:hypothetical protein
MLHEATIIKFANKGVERTTRKKEAEDGKCRHTKKRWGAGRTLTVVARRVDHNRYIKPAVRSPRPPSVAFESSREVPLPRISGIFTAHMAHNCENDI